jgi:hypothetical protein
MKSGMMRFICRMLIVALAGLPFQSVQAGMIGTGQVVAVAGSQADRSAVLSLISRSDVASQMQSMGVDSKTALDRVAAMTDQEVRALAGNIDSLPAGARSNGWTIAVVLIIAVVLWYNWK